MLNEKSKYCNPYLFLNFGSELQMGVTIKDIAKETGLSYSTVSKALNNSPLVKKPTKEKVLKSAKALGYQPNFAARNLVKKKSQAIGLAWPTIERIALSALVTEINKKIEEQGYSMILSINPIKSAIELFKRMQVDGILVFEESEKDLIESFIPESIPLVSYGVPNQNSYPIIDVNHKKAIFIAVHYLFELGHKHISYIGDLSQIDLRQQKKALGFRESMNQLQLNIDPNFGMIDTRGLDWFDGYKAAKRLIESNSLPTGLISGSYDISQGVLRALKEAQLKIPEDILLIGYDNIPQMKLLETPLTSVGVPIDKLADKMVTSVMNLVENKQTVPRVQLIQPELSLPVVQSGKG
ncbi:LacI family DNA-binding transcriptional regulator [Pseudalkalibacillus decolorationis]|uniref:LacI family DNA-binding transcriptional regulator n=1 Tax=Pseudalkalibacillus decolorationis TaxID=163879 RepID=UPI00214993BA|nr:LacI family DNA-binding transcriptional regulator [Pseudalkalibacillus decolorationis]